MKTYFKALLAATLLVASASYSSAQNGPRGQLLVGASKVDVTPAENELRSNSYGILDRTNVRAIIFSNGSNKAGFVNVDGNTRENVVDIVNERAEKELGIPKGNIIYNGTHCHSTGTVGNDELAERMYKAIKQAHDAMVPAKVGYGNGVSYLNVKRDLFDAKRGTWWEGPDYDGKSDKTVAVIYFESLEGKPIATYYNYAMHAVITGQLDMITGDFPGKSEEYIESAYPEDSFVAMFASGAAGDQNPLYFQQTFDLRDIRIADYAKRGEDISNKMPSGGVGLDRNDPETARLMGEQKRMAESYGQILGEEVRYVMMMMERFESNVTINCGRKIVTCPGRKQLNGGGRAGYAGQYEDADPINIALALVMLDDIPVTAVAGEVYNPIAVRLKKESPYAHTIMTTVADGKSGWGGYIPDDESYGAEVFEVLSSRFKQGYAESAIVNGLLDLIHDATH